MKVRLAALAALIVMASPSAALAVEPGPPGLSGVDLINLQHDRLRNRTGFRDWKFGSGVPDSGVDLIKAASMASATVEYQVSAKPIKIGNVEADVVLTYLYGKLCAISLNAKGAGASVELKELLLEAYGEPGPLSTPAGPLEAKLQWTGYRNVIVCTYDILKQTTVLTFADKELLAAKAPPASDEIKGAIQDLE